MVVEMQLLMGLSATAFATTGMAADGGFTDLEFESAAGFDRGAAAYWWTIWGAAVAWQMSFLGTAGMVFLTTSLTGGVCTTALLAVNVAGGVVVYSDEFGGVKAPPPSSAPPNFLVFNGENRERERGRWESMIELADIVL
ncbi:probable purine permease 4 [Salvia miltiorrhiza]|uniref:probable purine permease 4 n=1 Tax=Salvia miltiorrhiza TaxID=226208 RepID=UPI0025ABD6C6|nr:probable purine permease 4 [Salvia miltiorrhiza]